MTRLLLSACLSLLLLLFLTSAKRLEKESINKDFLWFEIDSVAAEDGEVARFRFRALGSPLDEVPLSPRAALLASILCYYMYFCISYIYLCEISRSVVLVSSIINRRARRPFDSSLKGIVLCHLSLIDFLK